MRAPQRNSNDCELETLAIADGITAPSFAKRVSPLGQHDSSLVIYVEQQACILCYLSIRV